MTSNEDQLAALLLRWEESWEQGEDVPAAQLCAECPAMADPLQAQIDVLKKMAWMKKDAAEEVQPNGNTDAPLVGKTLAGRYRIDQFVGEGGFGQVYRAFDTELQREVAVKVARQQAQGTDALLHEARRVAQLRHPGIVAVHDVAHDDKTLFVVSDFIGGENLAQLLQPVDPWEAARLAADVAEALHFAHEQGFVHRDIKPANILIDKQGRPLVADFGIAATGEELAQGARISSGTLPYMAPEQLAGEVQLIDGRTDVYALGVVLYKLLTGRQPHGARTPTALREQILFRAPSSFDAPAELREICLRCLAKHPADRYASAKELAEALRNAIADHNRTRRWRLPLVLLLVAVVIAAAIAGVHFLPSSAKRTAFVQDGAFVFDGTNRIVTPVERFAPVTLEAWVRPEKFEYRSHAIVGSNINGEWGISLTISGVVLAAEYIEGELKSKQVVPVREWSHVAAMFGERETRLYFNGKLVATGPPTKIKGGTRFVIGNVGENSPIDYFIGQIRSVRISRGERYQGDFVPDEEFRKDADDGLSKAILIYDGKSVKGGEVLDLSGSNNTGEVTPPIH
jgi:hypothetical protein